MAVGEFPDDEEGQGDRRDQRAADDEVRLEPVQVVALVEDDLQGADADHQGDQADVVHRRLLDHHRACLQLLVDDESGEQADRHVDEEDPRPAVVVGDPAAEDRPGDRRHHRDHREQGQGHAALRRWVDGDQQGLGDRIQRPGDEALQGAEADQRRHRLGDAAEERGEYEQQRGGDEQAHLADPPGQPAGQRQGDGVAHGERGDHPGALFRTHPEVTGDGRQGDVGDGGVEHLHESRQGQADGRHHQAGRGEAAAFAHAGGLNAGRSCRGLRRGWLRSGVRSACRPRPVAAGRHRWRTALRAVAAGPGPGRSGRADRP